MKYVSGAPSVELMSIGAVDDDAIRRLASELERELGIPVRHGRPFAPREEWFEPDERSIRSDAVLDSLTDLADRRADASGPLLLLALSEAPLFAPGRTTTFGQATQGGCCAVVSIASLGSPTDPRWNDRLLTESIHELGHVFGLGHCHDSSCVMFPSRDLHATDVKGHEFCPACAPRSAPRVSGPVGRVSP
jgi:archaemetzincin